MITRASFRNFKSLREVDVDFDSRLTVLVGPNGSGKSSVLQGISLLSQAASDPSGLDPVLRALPRHRAVGEPSGTMSLEGVGEPWPGQRVGLRLAVEFDDWASEPADKRSTWAYLAEDTDGRKEWVGNAPSPMTTAMLHSEFGHAVFLRMDYGRLVAPSLPLAAHPAIGVDGSGLAAALAHLKLSKADEFTALFTEFRNLIPQATGIQFDLVPSEQGPYQYQLRFDFRGVPGVRATEVSTGTMYALGVLAAIMINRPGVVLLDDIDHGLHPKAQLELIAVLRRLLNRKPPLQVIATSHSPYILDRLEWNEVRVTSLNDDGSAVCKPLTDHPDYERWKEAMSPGEFWSTFYEDWLKKAPAAQPEPVA